MIQAHKYIPRSRLTGCSVQVEPYEKTKFHQGHHCFHKSRLQTNAKACNVKANIFVITQQVLVSLFFNLTCLKRTVLFYPITSLHSPCKVSSLNGSLIFIYFLNRRFESCVRKPHCVCKSQPWVQGPGLSLAEVTRQS